MKKLVGAVTFDIGRDRMKKLVIKICGGALILAGAAVLPANAASATKLNIAAIGQAPIEADQEGGILDGRTSNISAAADFHEFICAYNSDGGMLTAIVNAALRQEVTEVGFNVSIESGKEAYKGVLDGSGAQISFPWYKPNCDASSYLTSHTKKLCNDFHWSDSIYQVIVGYFTAKDYDRPLRGHDDVFGTTFCAPGIEFPQMLHEVGISDLNTRIVVRRSPAACLTAIVKGEADITLMPINIAGTEVEHLGLEGEIIPHVSLDRVLSLHAVAPDDSPSAVEGIETLNRGLQDIRKSGEWFSIVEKFANGHEHDHAYDLEVLQSQNAKSE